MMSSNIQLSLTDTKVLKGLALLFLLAHHLFYIQNGLYDDIHLCGERFLVQQIGWWCKVCVAIFVFLSGYGLMVQAEKDGGVQSVSRFYWHRFSKLLLNYWFIWLTFVPIGVFVFGRTFSEAYGAHVLPRLIMDFFGVLNCVGLYGYNPTWWFYSCIIVLYLAFPLLYKAMDRFPMMVIPLVLMIYYIPFQPIYGIKIYFASFVAGMAMCRYGAFGERIKYYWCLPLFLILSIERFFVTDVYLLDAAITLALVLFYKTISFPVFLTKFLCFLGKHSMNIFLFHTFIFYYWFQEYIYITRNPLIIYISLLCACILISILIEKLKLVLHFESLTKKIYSLYV